MTCGESGVADVGVEDTTESVVVRLVVVAFGAVVSRRSSAVRRARPVVVGGRRSRRARGCPSPALARQGVARRRHPRAIQDTIAARIWRNRQVRQLGVPGQMLRYALECYIMYYVARSRLRKNKPGTSQEPTQQQLTPESEDNCKKQCGASSTYQTTPR